jgi:hypothetical protein
MSSTPINLRALAQCLNASPARVGSTTRKVVQQVLTDYDPSGDYWKWMREKGFARDRAGSRDGQAVMNAARTVRDLRKQPHYLSVAENWPTIATRWDDCAPEKFNARSIPIGGQFVAVRPTFAERWPDGTLDVVYVWCNLEELSGDTINALLRVMQRAFPEATCTFVDARNPENIHASAGKRLNRYDDWLDQTGLYIANLLAEAA